MIRTPAELSFEEICNSHRHAIRKSLELGSRTFRSGANELNTRDLFNTDLEGIDNKVIAIYGFYDTCPQKTIRHSLKINIRAEIHDVLNIEQCYAMYVNKDLIRALAFLKEHVRHGTFGIFDPVCLIGERDYVSFVLDDTDIGDGKFPSGFGILGVVCQPKGYNIYPQRLSE